MLEEVVFGVFSKKFGSVRAGEFLDQNIEVDLTVDVTCKVFQNIFDASE
jgi:hypothetical protein